MSDINSWLFPGAAMSANQLNNSLANNGNWLNNMLASQVAFNQAQPRLGEQAVYWSQRAANQLSAVPSLNPTGVWGEGGGGATPYQTTPDVWETGAAPFGGGGGSTGLERGWSTESWNPLSSSSAPSSGSGGYDFSSMFGGLAGGLGGTYQGPGTSAIDWSDMYRTASNAASNASFGDWSQYLNPTRNEADFGGSMFGGLGGGVGGAYQGPGSGIDWSNLFTFNRNPGVDPYPTMPMPGGLGQPMTLPQQQPDDYGSLMGRGAGGLGGAPSTPANDYAPAPMPKAPEYGGGMFGGLGGAGAGAGAAINWSKLFDGDSTPSIPSPSSSPSFNDRFGDWTAPATTPQPIPQAQQPQQPSQRYSDAMYGTSTGLEQPTAREATGITAADLAGGASQRLAKAMETLNKQPTSSDTTTTSDDMIAKAKGDLARVMAEGGDNTSPFAGYTRATQDVDPATAALYPTETPAEGEAGRSGMLNMRNAAAATDLYPGANPPRPSEDVPNTQPQLRRMLAPDGQEPSFFVVHHTSTGPKATPEGIVNAWKTERPGIGTQYIMDRNGIIHDVAKEYGYTGTNHAKDFNIPGTGISGRQGDSNSRIVGMEIMAQNERDVTAAQLAALQSFAQQYYPDVPFYGHGEISGNRMNDEGMRGANLITQNRPPGFNFDWSNAPIPDPINNPTNVRPPTSVSPNTAPLGSWQSSIPQGQRSPELQAAIETMARRYDIPPQSIAAAIGQESGWNPRSNIIGNPNYGLAQISRDDFSTAGGRLGGLTFDQYRNATPAQQIAVYSDFINSSPNRPYLEAGAGDPALTAAILQAIHFSPQSQEWSNRFAFGNDTTTPVTMAPQGRGMPDTSLDAMRQLFANRIAGWGSYR